MKNQKTKTPTPSKLSILRQLCNFIPNHLVPKLARETKADKKARTFLPWSHVVSLMFAQLAHSIGLNDVCDSLGLFSGPLSAIRGATPPTRNGLSHANKVRDAVMAEKLFWSVLEQLQSLSPGFRGGRKGQLVKWKISSLNMLIRMILSLDAQFPTKSLLGRVQLFSY